MAYSLTPDHEWRLTVNAKPRRKPRLCLLASLLILLPAPAFAQNARAAKTRIQTQYRRLAAALNHKDMDTYRSLHTAECVFLTPDGKPHSLDQLIAAITDTGRDTLHIQNVVIEIRSITPRPNGYVVLICEQLTISKTDDEGALGKKGQRHTILLTTSGRDLWQNKSGTWLRHKAHLKSILSLRVNGKRITKPRSDSMKLTPH